MKEMIFALLAYMLFSSISAQTDTIISQKPIKIQIYTTDGYIKNAILVGRTDSMILIFQGSKRDVKKQETPVLTGIHYQKITIIKTNKKAGFIWGLLIGGSIGLAPALIFGEAGAYVSVVTFPSGLIAGTIIGATSKKKHKINGDFVAFQRFTDTFIK